jgi:ribonuclease PH
MPKTARHDGRAPDELRPLRIETGYIGAADGSCLIEMGRTRVICTASFSPDVPEWRQASGLGWVTAEYGMLPASTGRRRKRPIPKQDGRSVEIQRLIGRSLRTAVRFDRMGPNTVYLDCDVIEADGGTRTASITGAQVALELAIAKAARAGRCDPKSVSGRVAAVSVGIVGGRCLLDLDYAEDSRAEVDMNLAMLGTTKFIEVQGTGERATFDAEQLQQLLALGRKGIRRLLQAQKQAVQGA